MFSASPSHGVVEQALRMVVGPCSLGLVTIRKILIALIEIISFRASHFYSVIYVVNRDKAQVNSRRTFSEALCAFMVISLCCWYVRIRNISVLDIKNILSHAIQYVVYTCLTEKQFNKNTDEREK
jgi:hypothetical protein